MFRWTEQNRESKEKIIKIFITKINTTNLAFFSLILKNVFLDYIVYCLILITIIQKTVEQTDARNDLLS